MKFLLNLSFVTLLVVTFGLLVHAEIYVGGSHFIRVDSLHVSCGSDNFEPNKNYEGLVIWHRGSQGGIIGSRNVLPGYLYLIKSENFMNPHTRTFDQDGAFKYVMGTSEGLQHYKDAEGILVSGFSFKNGQFKWNQNNEEQRPHIQNAVQSSVRQFWDSNGTQQNWVLDNSH
jgi:hypothetical protein